MDSGLSRSDAKSAFSRQRRRLALAQIASRLRHEPDDVSAMLPFEEVVAALGRTSQVDAGVRTIPLDAIVGTVDRRRGEFDREFRPASGDVRGRSGAHPPRPPAQDARAHVPRADPARRGRAGADQAVRRVALRPARDADRGLGLSREPRARAAALPRGDGGGVVP
jgi:hypothetical protein